ncbi:MAG: hypothetical protein WCP16_08960 [Pseudanabaena sp. ELA645]|jgi:hypothetical protein
MKGLVKDISSVAIAGLILAGSAIAANAQVVTNKVNPSQDAQKSLDLQITTKPLSADKQVVNNSPNQAKYLKSSPQSIAAEPSIFLAQESSSALREQLRVKPLPTAFYVPPSSGGNSPSLNFGVPSGFGAGWGNAFVSASGTTAGKAREKIDGSVSVGFGLGSADTIGVEFAYNQGSINNFGKNGTVDVKAHRIVYAEGTNQVSVGVGWNAFAQHTSEGVIPSSLYGVVSSYSLLQPDDPYNKLPISFSVGVGGGQFRPSDESTGVGVFAGAGVQVLPQLSVGASWGGRGINAGISYVPYPEIPLTFVLVGGDLTDNTSGGRILSLSASYGFNFLGK